MKSRLIAAAAGAVGLGVGLLLAPSPATAGHTNTLLHGRPHGPGRGCRRRLRGLRWWPNGRGEVYVFGIDGDPTTLCYILEVSPHRRDRAGARELRDCTTSTAARSRHDGPVEVNLAWPQDGQAADCLTDVSPARVWIPVRCSESLAEPATGYYVNVHNTEYPSGAVRGQLHGDHH